MSVSPIPLGAPIGTVRVGGQVQTVELHPHFVSWLSSVQNALTPSSGATAQRPVNSAANPLKIGQDFFDTTLGQKVSVKSLNPTVWVNGAGTAA